MPTGAETHLAEFKNSNDLNQVKKTLIYLLHGKDNYDQDGELHFQSRVQTERVWPQRGARTPRLGQSRRDPNLQWKNG